MREILFRGKDKVNGEWVTGFLVSPAHIGDWVTANPVDPETVGQFTGLADKHGKKIFEGDIVISYDMFGRTEGVGVVSWSDLFCCWQYAEHKSMYGGSVGSYEVIGNIHDGEDTP